VAGQGEIGPEIARIAREIVRIVELGGIDKHAQHDDVVFLAGAIEQGEVAFMQGAHRGNEPHAAAGKVRAAPQLQPVGEFFDGWAHTRTSWGAGKPPVRTSRAKALMAATAVA